MLYMCLHTKFANDRVFVSFLAKWVSNYQFEKKKLKTSSLNFECENYV